MRISAFNRSCERKQSHIYPSRSLKKVAISFDHDPILFSTANPADEVFGRHRRIWGTSASPWKTVAIILAVLLIAALVVIAMITTELTDVSFSLF
jgi:hypothetical protein